MKVDGIIGMNNYKLRELISKANGIGHKQIVSLTEIVQAMLGDDIERFVKQRAADAMAHHIAGDLMRGGHWQHTSLPEGEEFRVQGYWLTFEQLYRLLDEAHSLGRQSAMVVLPDGTNLERRP